MEVAFIFLIRFIKTNQGNKVKKEQAPQISIVLVGLVLFGKIRIVGLTLVEDRRKVYERSLYSI